MFWILGIILLVTFVYYFLIKPVNYWRERGVLQENTRAALFDSLFSVLQPISAIDNVTNIYKRFAGVRYYGRYLFQSPVLLIIDVDLIKQMEIKDSEHFNEHRSFIDAETDPMWGNNLFSLKGLKWRRMRTTLSPSFTSSKMKGMFVLMSDTAEKSTNFFLNKNEDLIKIDGKDIFSRYCTDVIASTAFGLEVDSLTDPTNQFFINGKDLLDFNSLRTIISICTTILFPKIAKMLKLTLIHPDRRKFFTKIIDDTIKLREEKGVIRHDMIHLLLEARKGNFKHDEHHETSDTGFATVEEHLEGDRSTEISHDDIVAQALVFFFAGFDTSSTLMCFLAYELCANQDIQDKLRNEIEETMENCDKLTYEALVNMEYMDMVISEALRKWPPSLFMERICTKPYTIQPVLPHEKPVHLEVGTPIGVAMYGVHHDPEYFPNPEKFDPERFSNENKGNIKPYTFQPFGLGPRNCIGSRFALLETKILFFYVLKHFKIVPVDNTDIPIVMKKSCFSLMPEKGFNFGLQPI